MLIARRCTKSASAPGSSCISYIAHTSPCPIALLAPRHSYKRRLSPSLAHLPAYVLYQTRWHIVDGLPGAPSRRLPTSSMVMRALRRCVPDSSPSSPPALTPPLQLHSRRLLPVSPTSWPMRSTELACMLRLLSARSTSSRLKNRFPAACGSSGHCLYISAFMIPSKAICDDTYSNRSWCVV